MHEAKRLSLVAKQVHDFIINGRMDQNIYVVISLLIAYIRCGKLEDACRVFDELVKKNVISWSVMIGADVTIVQLMQWKFSNKVCKDMDCDDWCTYRTWMWA